MEAARRAGQGALRGHQQFAAWHIVEGNCQRGEAKSPRIVSEQSLYNLAARTIELEVIPACRAQGVGILPWSPLSGGLLGGVLRKAREGRAASSASSSASREAAAARALGTILRELGSRSSRRSRWPGCSPTGDHVADHRPRTVAQLEGSLRALEITLPKKRSPRSTRSGPGPAARRRRRTPVSGQLPRGSSPALR